MIVGRNHIGERLIVQASGDPEPVAAAADGEHEMPFAVCEPFGGDAARSGDVGQGGSRETGRGRGRYGDRRTEFGAPEGGRLLGPGIGINGERPTPSGDRKSTRLNSSN